MDAVENECSEIAKDSVEVVTVEDVSNSSTNELATFSSNSSGEHVLLSQDESKISSHDENEYVIISQEEGKTSSTGHDENENAAAKETDDSSSKSPDPNIESHPQMIDEPQEPPTAHNEQLISEKVAESANSLEDSAKNEFGEKSPSEGPNDSFPQANQIELGNSTHQNNGQEDDEVIVVESYIKGVKNGVPASVNDGDSPPETAAAAAADSQKDAELNATASPASAPVTAPQPINVNQVDAAAAKSIPSLSSPHQRGASVANRPMFAAATTSLASVLKALASNQKPSSVSSRLSVATTANSSTHNQSLATLKSATSGSVRIVTSALPSQHTFGRQLLPKPAGGPSNQSNGQQQNVQVSRQETVLTNGAATPSTPVQNEPYPEYLKAVLNPASVLPYISELPPKEYGFLTPDGGFRCDECGDTFALKSCLEFHLQRRSVIIEASCVMCRQPLVFFNKCVYYAHIRQHSGNQRQVGKMVMRNVNVKPITWQLMELAFEDTAFKRMSDIEEFWKYETGCSMVAIENEDLETNTERNSPAKYGGGENQATAATNALACLIYNAANGGKSTERASTRKVCCSECNNDFSTATGLRQHFMYNLPSNQKQLICTNCQAVYFSHCSFKAHSRTHANVSPYTCPECGSVESTPDLLNAHVLTHQNNPTVMDAWRCQKCHTFYSSWDALIIHISAAHCDSYYRCQYCPMAFQSASAFTLHLRSQHENVVKQRAPDAKLLTKCCHCDVVYMAREPLLEHLKTHFTKLMPFIVYRCALCGRLMENKSGLLGHFRNVHRLNVSPSEVAPVKIQVPSYPPAATKRSATTAYENGKQTDAGSSSTDATIFNCPLCPNVAFQNKSSLQMHLNKRHADDGGTGAASLKGRQSDRNSESTPAESELTCRYCAKKFATVADLQEDGRLHLHAGIGVCLLCQNSDCGSFALLNKHLQNHIESQNLSHGEKRAIAYECDGHCGKTFAAAADALSHLRYLHLLPPLRCYACNIAFIDDSEFRLHLLRHETRADGTISSATSTPADPSEIVGAPQNGSNQRKRSGETPEESVVAKQRKPCSSNDAAADARCSKCSQTFSNTDEMRSHAVSHKEAKYYLCLECGLSFAATSSLGRHLIVAHRILNVAKYLLDHPASNPDKPSDLECSVCHMEFPSQTLLYSHVRTHGLLFLKTKARSSV